ncbi:MAG: carbohydrate kinase family protein [Oscillospiraceae bacterium]|nr:carbohydrate kinase family protein [Oscillospiraceae bacterium]
MRMGNILIAGLINSETTVKIKEFPVPYFPIAYPFFGVKTTVSGVAVNIAKALSVLGDSVTVISLLGKDMAAESVLALFGQEGWDTKYLQHDLSATAQSVVLYDETGKRQIYCDLKDYQDQTYNEAFFAKPLQGCDIAVVCNSNFCRPLLHLAKQNGILIATDVHVLRDIHDPYNQEFLQSADILFLSDEGLSETYETVITQLKETYGPRVIVIGLGAKGAMLYCRAEDAIYQVDAVFTRSVVNTVGAGDALFSSFIHYYSQGEAGIDALKKAVLFASYKIGEAGGARGFLSAQEVDAYYEKTVFHVTKCN